MPLSCLVSRSAPINWALINGETKTGVTTFFIDKIDTGAIILSKETVKAMKETQGRTSRSFDGFGRSSLLNTRVTENNG
jgi:methionyl-tRNA formyltransferase